MNRQENIKKMYEQAKLNTINAKDKAVLKQMKEIYLEESKAEIKTTELSLWSNIMKNRITKFATAAIIFAGILIGMNYFGGAMSSVALADVAEKIKQFDSLIQEEHRIVTNIRQDGQKWEMDVKKYISTKYGSVEQQYDQQGNIMTTVYLLKNTQEIITVIHPAKQYFTISLKNTNLELPDFVNPKGIVEFIVLEQNPVKLGTKEIDGKKAEGFEAVNPKAMTELAKLSNGMLPIGDNKWKLWVDVKTELPIKIEAEYTMTEGPMTNFMAVNVVSETKNLEWGAKFDDSIFNPDIPDDYKPIDSSAFMR
ncbi:MAG: hypothetical protein JXA96_00725 [Sedimentisphaerales bacterium]|nr:hypothetical protein [Sedimentisphaerales bacterium]